jgi:hypothetical protein
LKGIPSDIKEFLDEKVSQYNTLAFIESDPISIPHRYNLKEEQPVEFNLRTRLTSGIFVRINSKSNSFSIHYY